MRNNNEDGLNGLEKAIVVEPLNLIDLVNRMPVDAVLVVGTGEGTNNLRESLNMALKKNILATRVYAVEGVQYLNPEMFTRAKKIAVVPYDKGNEENYKSVERLLDYFQAQGVNVSTYYVINSLTSDLPQSMIVPRS